MSKMCAIILQLVSAPLDPIPIAEHFRRTESVTMQTQLLKGRGTLSSDDATATRTSKKHFFFFAVFARN